MNANRVNAKRVIFVCWGNICRSPMAAAVAKAYAIDGDTVISSAGVSAEELGNPMDPRARRVLAAAGYPVDDHRAHQITAAEIGEADLIIAMEQSHIDLMRRLLDDSASDATVDTEIRLLTDFDPEATPGSGVPDPWYGREQGFGDTLATIERAMPDIMTQLTGRRAPPG